MLVKAYLFSVLYISARIAEEILKLTCELFTLQAPWIFKEVVSEHSSDDHHGR